MRIDEAVIYKATGNRHKLKHTYEIYSNFEFRNRGSLRLFRKLCKKNASYHILRYKLEVLVSEFCLRFRQDEIFESSEDYLRICLYANQCDL